MIWRLLMLLVLIVSVAITIKTSFVVYGGLIMVAGAARYIRKYGLKDLFVRKTIFILLIALATIFVWQIRSVVVSGYFLYPLFTVSLPVDWKISLETVVYDMHMIKSWARQPGESWEVVLASSDWIGKWVETNIRDLRMIVPLVGTLLVSIVRIAQIVYRRMKINQKSIPDHNLLLPLIIIPIVSIIFWFISAPDIRFAGASFFVLYAFLGAIVGVSSKSNKWRIIAISIMLILPSALIISGFNGIDKSYLVSPAEAQNYKILPNPECEQIKISDIYACKPTESDQCWDKDLLCGPYLSDRKIELRDGENIENGFKLAD